MICPFGVVEDVALISTWWNTVSYYKKTEAKNIKTKICA